MRRLVLVLACVVCKGLGRRVQIHSKEQSRVASGERQELLMSEAQASTKGILDPLRAFAVLLLSHRAAAAFTTSGLGHRSFSRSESAVSCWWSSSGNARAAMLNMLEGKPPTGKRPASKQSLVGKPPTGKPPTGKRPASKQPLNGNRRTKDEPSKDGKGGLRAWLHSFSSQFSSWMALPALAVLLLVRLFVVQPFYIPSNSMYPTLIVNDQVAVETFSKNFGDLRRGDIVVFTLPGAFYEVEDRTEIFPFQNERNPQFIKRVVAVEGDTVEVSNGVLLVNGKQRYEPYVSEAMRYTFAKMKVPANSIFVLGDNRNLSDDSHKWGALPASNVVGKAFYILWPIQRQGFIDQVMQDLEITGDPGPFFDIAREATTDFSLRKLPKPRAME